MINMSIDSFPIPAIFISQADGQAMVAAAKDGGGTLTVSNSTYDAPSETGGQPSSFSLGLDVPAGDHAGHHGSRRQHLFFPSTTIPMV